jgi:hypothetical protein
LTGIRGVNGHVGVKANVCGRRRFAGGEESSGNDANFIGDEEFSSIEGRRLGDADG